MNQLQTRFAAFQDDMNATLIEREDEVLLAATALVARQHIFLCGAPGTAKSMLADGLVDWMAGKVFRILLTKYTTPEELFGPISIAGLKKDEYRRIIKNTLPEATVAFVDEVWKGSSAILNTLLKILNEGVFQNNGQLIHCPLQCCIAASNEFPNPQEGGRDLAAMFDRFLIRKMVHPIASDRGRDKLLWSDLSLSLSSSITPAEIETAHTEALSLPWSAAAKKAFIDILKSCQSEGILPGDRRQRQSAQLCQAAAWVAGEAAVETDHLEVLAHTFWLEPEQAKKVQRAVAKIAAPASLLATQVIEEITEILAEVDQTEFDSVVPAMRKLKEQIEYLQNLKGAKAARVLEWVKGVRDEMSKKWAS